ncbi:hypothetical protein MRS44_018242 [Fusarium solani]|uniref:uncharacterized protein n=1 Tax=Fusarium solani TaxID=169388 RepID=UPI0032C44724|nr:hypothetical protein MRS44_018242 [Fusarium solani]
MAVMRLTNFRTIAWTVILQVLFGTGHADDLLPSRRAGLSERDVSYVNAVYFVNWLTKLDGRGIYQRNFQPHDLPASALTHVLYAFMNVGTNGTVYTADSYADLEKHYENDSWNEGDDNAYGCVKQLYLLKMANRNLKVMLSIGGWTWSQAGSFEAANTAEGRSTFAKSAVTLMKDWGFDGIDIDWEYPKDETEAASLTLLLRAVREELDSYAAEFAPGHHFLLSIAAPAGPGHYGKLDFPALAQVLDYVNLMSYDYLHLGSVASHTSNLYKNSGLPGSTPFNTHDAVQAYLDGGIPAEKIILGMPAYGRSFQATSGLGEPYSGVGLPNSGPGNWEGGIWEYKVLPKQGGETFYDDIAQASYSYDATTRELISYDSPQAVQAKVAYVKHAGLGGTMFWEASGDKTGPESLVGTSFRSLGSIDQTENWLDYPNSRYRNIASGMKGQ